MNETNIKESLQDISVDTGNADLVNYDTGLSDNSLSLGSISEPYEADNRADLTSPNVWTGSANSSMPSVSYGDIATHAEADTEVLMEIQENTSQILKNVFSLASVSVLIFMFLLFEWTEKKLKVTVNRFTDKRRN